MSNNKIGVLNTKLTIEEFVKENPQYTYSSEDDVLSGDKGFWCFLFPGTHGNIFLAAERHIPNDMLFELLSKYGGEYYESEYDRKPTKVFASPKKIDSLINDATQRSKEQCADESKSEVPYIKE